MSIMAALFPYPFSNPFANSPFWLSGLYGGSPQQSFLSNPFGETWEGEGKRFLAYLKYVREAEDRTLPARFADFCRRLDTALAKHGLSA